MAVLSRRITRRYSFVIRLLLSTLLAALIPLMMTFNRQLNEQVTTFRENIETHLQENTSSIARRLDSCVTSMDSVSFRFMEDPTLTYSVLSSKISSQLDAFETLEDYLLLLPFVENYCIYDTSLSRAFTVSGTYSTAGTAKTFFDTDESLFLEYLDSCSNSPSFVTQVGDTGKFVYIRPLWLNNASGSMRYVLFLLSPSSLTDFLKSEIPDGAEISALSCGDTMLFGAFLSEEQTEEQENILVKTAFSANGLRVQLSVDKTIIQQNLEDIKLHSLLIAAINTVLCILLIAVVVFMNYRPLAKVINTIRRDKTNTSQTEIETLISHFTALEQQNKTLSLELYEKKLMITDRILENLLSGKKVPPSDVNTIQMKLPYYRVVCVPLERIKNVSDVIVNNLKDSTIYAIEMYPDKLLTILCGQNSNDPDALDAMLKNIRTLLRDSSIPLGISHAFSSHSLSTLYVAYHQAGQALSSVADGAAMVFAPSEDAAPLLLDEKWMDVGKLSRAIAEGQDYMVQLAAQVLDELLARPGVRANKRYACYQLIDLYRIAFERSGVKFDVTELTQTLQESSLSTLRERFLAMLNTILMERPAMPVQNDNQTPEKIIAYINSHFTDPLLNMDMVADYMGVSVFTASRIFKSVVGINFRQYLNDLRIEYAQELLLTTEFSVSEISKKSGFSSASYFISTFRKAEDITPNAFRLQNGIETTD